MTDWMLNLRRSPRKLLERDGHTMEGPGRIALVMARAGGGKTAFLVDIGLDALLAGKKVLHISLDSTVEKVRTWYDDILSEMLRSEKKLEHWGAIQLEVEKRRHIHTYMDHQLTGDRLREALGMLKDVMHFVPDVILLDDTEAAWIDLDNIRGIKQAAKDAGSELWMTCQTYRDGEPTQEGHLPPPADQIQDLVDLAFRLDPHESKIRLRVLKDRDQMLDEDLHILLDPQTMLVGFGA